MDNIGDLFDFISNLDEHLLDLFHEYGLIAYGVLFLVIFFESTITPMLPGDSLIFTAGALATRGRFSVHLFLVLFVAATVGGVTASYFLGKWMGPSLFKEKSRFFTLGRLERTRAFYQRRGATTMIVSRFIPVVRTFAPIVGGMAGMRFRVFMITNLIGGVVWVALFLYGGYFFGNLPVVRDHFAIVVAAVFLVSMLPLIAEWLRQRKEKRG